MTEQKDDGGFKLFFDTLLGVYPEKSYVELRVISSRTQDRKQHFYRVGAFHLDELRSDAESSVARQGEVYLGVNPRSSRKGGADNVAHVTCLIADIDFDSADGKPKAWNSEEEALAALKKFSGPPPTMIVRSGGGLQPYWLLRKPLVEKDEQEAAQRAMRAMQTELGSSTKKLDSMFDKPRILRVPGTYNFKYRGEPRRVELLYAYPDRLYSLSDFTVPDEEVKENSAGIGSGSGKSVIYDDDEELPGNIFNQHAEWEDILEPYGWVLLQTLSDGEQRWRRPGKERGGLGATTLHGGRDIVKIFTDAAPPFEAGEAYSKFSAYAILEHGGDRSAAAADLANQGYTNDPYSVTDPSDRVSINLPLLVNQQVDEELDEAVQEEQSYYQAELELPPGTFDLPGIMGEMYSWVEKSAWRSAPLLSLGGVIAALGALFGCKYRSPMDTRPNVYVVGVASTAAGKDNVRKRTRSLMRAAGATKLIGGRLLSTAGLEVWLAERLKMLIFIDEMGGVLNSWEKSNASYEVRMKDMLKELFEAADSIYESPMVLNREPVDLVQPHLCLYGTTTHDQLYRSLTSASVKDGFLNRLLVFELPEGRNKKKKPSIAHLAPPGGIVNWVKRVHEYTPKDPSVTGNLSNSGSLANGVKFPLHTVRYQAAADRALDAFDEEADEKMEGVGAFLWARAAAHAHKLAMIRAIGCNWEEPEVRPEDAIWAINLVRWATARLCKSVDERMVENEVEGNVKRVLKIIRDAGPDGITRKRLIRASLGLKSKDLDEVIKTLDGAALVSVQQVPGRKANNRQYKEFVYRATSQRLSA